MLKLSGISSDCIYLGLSPPLLAAIGRNFITCQEQYTEVLHKWLNGGVTRTIRKLIEALESNMVKENGLATRLRSKYVARRAKQKGDYDLSLCHTVLYT